MRPARTHGQAAHRNGGSSSPLLPREGLPSRPVRLLRSAGRAQRPGHDRPDPRRGPGSVQRALTRALVLLFDAGALALGLLVVAPPSPLALLFAVGAPLSLAFSGHYSLRLRLSALADMPTLLLRLVAPALLLNLVAADTRASQSLYVQAAVTALGLCCLRGIAYHLIRQLRRNGSLLEPTLIVGTGEVAVELANVMAEHPEHGLKAVGFVEDPPDDGGLPLPVVAATKDLDITLRRYDIHRIIIAFGRVRDVNWVRFLREAVTQGVEVYFVPRFFELGVHGIDGADEVWGIPLRRIQPSALGTRAWRAKRVLDVCCAAALLAFAAPVLAVVAAAVRLTSPGPILYRQTRVGQHGRHFELLKFRSMRLEHPGDRQWDAPRQDLTPIGGFLRRSGIDELPQLWNVLRGDMSLVGPRPERPFFVEQFAATVPGYRDRHRLAVGLTGWAQVHGLRGSDTSLPHRTRFDNSYIDRWSLWLDIVVIVRTMGVLLRETFCRTKDAGR